MVGTSATVSPLPRQPATIRRSAGTVFAIFGVVVGLRAMRPKSLPVTGKLAGGNPARHAVNRSGRLRVQLILTLRQMHPDYPAVEGHE
jgi:hypothetical protein